MPFSAPLIPLSLAVEGGREYARLVAQSRCPSHGSPAEVARQTLVIQGHPDPAAAQLVAA